jgi:hypothetical protein
VPYFVRDSESLKKSYKNRNADENIIKLAKGYLAKEIKQLGVPAKAEEEVIKLYGRFF